MEDIEMLERINKQDELIVKCLRFVVYKRWIDHGGVVTPEEIKVELRKMHGVIKSDVRKRKTIREENNTSAPSPNKKGKTTIIKDNFQSLKKSEDKASSNNPNQVQEPEVNETSPKVPYLPYRTKTDPSKGTKLLKTVGIQPITSIENNPEKPSSENKPNNFPVESENPSTEAEPDKPPDHESKGHTHGLDKNEPAIDDSENVAKRIQTNKNHRSFRKNANAEIARLKASERDALEKIERLERELSKERERADKESERADKERADKEREKAAKEEAQREVKRKQEKIDELTAQDSDELDDPHNLTDNVN